MYKNFTQDDDAKVFSERFNFHLAQPRVSVEQYLHRLRIQTYEKIAAKTRIYLDNRYWIFLRDASAGRAKVTTHEDILRLARDLVSTGRAVFPISATSFVEIMGQPHSDARLNTARLVEQLSCKVAICAEHERIPTEIANAFYKYGGRKEVHDLHELVWVSIGAIFGPVYPRNPNLDASCDLAAQKAFLDSLWQTSLASMIDIGASSKPFPDMDFAGIARRLTDGCREHIEDVRHGFRKTYLNEIAGALDLFRETGVQVLIALRDEEHPGAPRPSDSEREMVGQSVYSFLVSAAEQGVGPAIFPSLDVQARLHAAIRRDTQRPFRKNDLPDIHHAMAAVPYCHAFFTELPLHSLLTSPHTGVKDNYSCTVIHAEDDALTFLKSLS